MKVKGTELLISLSVYVPSNYSCYNTSDLQFWLTPIGIDELISAYLLHRKKVTTYGSSLLAELKNIEALTLVCVF